MKVNLKDFGLKDKIVNVPNVELDRLMKGLELDQEEAIQVYLEDEGYLDNEEQEELEKKGKEARITATIHQAKSEKKQRKEYERKADPTKEGLIKALSEFLENYGAAAVNITNVGKIVEFDLADGEHYKLDLIRQRKKKA